MSFIINPASINHASIRQDLVNFLAVQADATKWSPFFESTTGQNLIDLMSGLAAFFQYQTITARREAYIQFSKNRSSLLGAANFLGYSAFRGRNAIVSLTIIPATTGTWPKWYELGTVKDRKLILLSETIHNIGVPVTVLVAIGEIEIETILSPNTNLNVFKFTQKNVSEDIRVYFSSTEVAISKEIEDLLDGKVVCLSNSFGSVDVKYLNQLSFINRYTTGTAINLHWIDLKDTDFTLNDLALYISEGTLTVSSLNTVFTLPEGDDEIRVNAPLRSETKSAVRGRQDQPKIIKRLDTRIISASGEDVSAAIMRIYCVLLNDLRFNDAEKLTIISSFEPFRPHGLLPPIISAATRFKTQLNITYKPVVGAVGNIQTIINAKLATLNLKLGQTLDTDLLEQFLEDQDFIKIARVSLKGSTFLPTFAYELGELVTPTVINGKVYRVFSLLSFSGVTQPIWPIVADATINDGDIQWKAIPKTELAGISAWAASTAYTIGAIVKPSVVNNFVYEAVIEFRKSLGTQPTWPPLAGAQPEDLIGSFVKDGDILWQARPQEGTPPVWLANTHYEKGYRVKATNQISSDTVAVMFEVYAYLGQTSTEPIWPVTVNNTINSGNIKFVCLDPEGVIFELSKGQYWNLSATPVII